MKRPEEVTWHLNEPKDGWFPHEANRQISKDLCDHVNFAAEKLTLSPLPAARKEVGKEVCDWTFPVASNCTVSYIQGELWSLSSPR